MTNRVAYAPQDFQKMCKQAERDHESKKLVVLMERVKRQIAERENPGLKVGEPKHPGGTMNSDSGLLRLPSRSVPFER
jgi:murein endopeptidase